jgi:hypothetical protein
MGREVETPVNERLNSGSYETPFDGSRYGGALAITSRVYFYKLEINGYNDVKKMMLVK